MYVLVPCLVYEIAELLFISNTASVFAGVTLSRKFATYFSSSCHLRANVFLIDTFVVVMFVPSTNENKNISKRIRIKKVAIAKTAIRVSSALTLLFSDSSLCVCYLQTILVIEFNFPSIHIIHNIKRC